MSFSILSRPTGLAEDAYQKLRKALFNFELLPGDRFTEQQLCKYFNISRTPIRQALFRLQQDGHIEVLFRNGWRVLPLDFKLFDDLYEFRVMIETEAVKRLCLSEFQSQDFSQKILSHLEQCWMVSASEQISDPTQLSQLDESFHTEIVRASGNRVMAECHNEITERIRIIRKLDFSHHPRIEATYTEHAKILRAIVNKHSDQARLLIKAHIESSQIEVRKLTLHQLQKARDHSSFLALT